MQRLKILSEALDQLGPEDVEDRERIQEEIWNLEEEMEFVENMEYKNNHISKKLLD